MGTRFSALLRCFAAKWLLMAAVALLLGSAAMAQAPSTIFQLNGDSANDSLNCTPPYTTPPTTCDFWNGINLTGSSGQTRLHSGINTFIDGATGSFAFQGGGSKDPNLISS